MSTFLVVYSSDQECGGFQVARTFEHGAKGSPPWFASRTVTIAHVSSAIGAYLSVVSQEMFHSVTLCDIIVIFRFVNRGLIYEAIFSAFAFDLSVFLFSTYNRPRPAPSQMLAHSARGDVRSSDA